jgi:hypothetical protein
MTWSRYLLAVLILLCVSSSPILAHGYPSGGTYPPEFTQRRGEWYDSWGYNRNYAEGNDGFLPNLAYESIGTNRELAYSIGEQFKNSYTDRVQRAEAILSYVQRWTDYGYDEDNVRVAGQAQPEWAWNADEMAHMFDENTLTVATGDCEDMSFLCSTIYLTAGYEVVLVSPEGHVALMIWLPEYDNANYIWDMQDGRGEGWIWVEATGEQNPLGWTPPDFSDGNFQVYQLSSMISINYSPSDPQAEDDVTVTVSVSAQSSPIQQVLLRYSVNGGSYSSLVMTYVGSSTYKANIPRQAKGAVVKFYAYATDTQGIVSESSELSYTVGGGFEVPGLDIPGLQIPGFPWESIVVGLALGFVAMYLLAARRLSSSMAGAAVRSMRRRGGRR